MKTVYGGPAPSGSFTRRPTSTPSSTRLNSSAFLSCSSAIATALPAERPANRVDLALAACRLQRLLEDRASVGHDRAIALDVHARGRAAQEAGSGHLDAALDAHRGLVGADEARRW